MVLTDNQIMNLLMKELVSDAAEETYVAAPTEFINNAKCNVLYVPRNPPSTCPLVFVEVQNQTDENFFVRAVQYSTLIFERYNKLPILLIIGVSTVTTSFMYMTEVDSAFSFTRSIPCLGWAKHCLLLSPSTLKLNEYKCNEELNPLQAIGVFTCSQATSMKMLDVGKNNNTIKHLYTIAHSNVEQIKEEDDEKLEAISNI